MHHVHLILAIIVAREQNIMQMRFSILIPIKPLGLIVYGSRFLADNVLAIECIFMQRDRDMGEPFVRKMFSDLCGYNLD